MLERTFPLLQEQRKTQIITGTHGVTASGVEQKKHKSLRVHTHAVTLDNEWEWELMGEQTGVGMNGSGLAGTDLSQLLQGGLQQRSSSLGLLPLLLG